jgi:hypothetical protein
VSVFDRWRKRSPEEEQRLDTRVRDLVDPFSHINEQSNRLAALPPYLEKQRELGKELIREIDLDEERIGEPAALDIVWDHFLSRRSTVRRQRKGRGRKSLSDEYRYDMKTLDLIEKMAAIFSSALEKSIPELTWTVAHDPEGKYILEGRPVLRGFPGMIPEMNPAQVILNIANRSMGSDKREVLSELFQRWLQSADRGEEEAEEDS